MRINWDQFKTFQNARGSDILMFEDDNYYYLFTSENGFNANCDIDKNASDTIELYEFENDYLDICNPKKITKVTPTAPSNDYDLKPYGVTHKHINSSNYVASITLSNKNATVFDYSSTVTPEDYDCIWGNHGQLRDGVLSVDSSAGTLVTWDDILSNDTYTISKPINIDCELPLNYSTYYLWGMYFSAIDFGEDDLVRLQIVDVDNIIGYGADFIVKEYDECWVNQVNDIKFIKTPDGAPGEIPAGLYLRVKYYPKDATKTDIKVWVDYAITIKS